MSKPSEVNNSTINDTSVVLTWSEPIDPNGIITKYNINLVAISSDPRAFSMMMGGMMGGTGTGDRRKRQSNPMNPVNTNCIRGGEGNVDRNFTRPGNMLNLTLDDLSELAACCTIIGPFHVGFLGQSLKASNTYDTNNFSSNVLSFDIASYAGEPSHLDNN